MTVDQYFALVASAAALMAAIAALGTVLMMARQLRAAYRPELALSRAVIRSTRVNGEILPRLWIESPESDPDYIPSSMYGLCIEVRNIGLGTANDVRIKWSFPIEEVVKEVNEIAGSGRVLTYNRGSERLNVRLDDRRVQSVGWTAHRRGSIDYIMPASIETTPTTLMVPPAYQSVASAMVSFDFSVERRKNCERHRVFLRLNWQYVTRISDSVSTACHLMFVAELGGGIATVKLCVDILSIGDSIARSAGTPCRPPSAFRRRTCPRRRGRPGNGLRCGAPGTRD